MDTILQGFLTWQFLVFALAIGAVVFVIRQFIEYWMSNWWPLKSWTAANSNAKLWRELILPILPVALGLAGAIFAKGYPYPEGFATTSGRVGWGLVAGFTSGLFVRMYNSFLAAKTSEFADRVTNFIKPSDNSSTNNGSNNIPSSEPDKNLEDLVRNSIQKDQQS